MSKETPLGRYEHPSSSEKKWNRKHNGDSAGPEDIWAQQEIEISGSVPTFDDLPAPDPSAETDNGQRRRVVAYEENIVYRDTGSGWEPIAGIGTEETPVPTTAYFDGVAAVGQLIIPVYETEGDLPDDPDVEAPAVAYVIETRDIYYPDKEKEQ